MAQNDPNELLQRILGSWKIILGVIIALILLFSGFVQVATEEVGVITRFGI
ncbi:MAG: hypothetical protein U5L96_06710 [Owenweeksia sp.]|nr:hypothetical protein [Owenweeksia sp.]